MSELNNKLKTHIGRLLTSYRQYPEKKRALQNIQPAPTLLITGSPRSGTTWLGAMLDDPGTWHIHEPFNTNQGLWKDIFTYCTQNNNYPNVDKLLVALLSGKKRSALKHTFSSLEPIRLLPSFNPPRRILLKDPFCCLMSSYIATKFDIQTIHIWRHPAAFAESVTRLKWPVGIFLTNFLSDKALMENHLSPYIHLIEKYQNEDSLEAAVIEHACLYKVMHEQAKNCALIKTVFFEELSINPVDEIVQIYEWANWPLTDTAKQRHIALTSGKTSKSQYHPHAVTRKSKTLAYAWKNRIDAHKLGDLRIIWEHFELPFYQDDDQW